VVFNDLHDDTGLFGKLTAHVKDKPYDFSLFNGDCFNDPATEGQVLRVLAAYARGIGADRIPAVFVRGNHETRGAYARQLGNLFDYPRGRPYFAFTQGPVRFVVLDCGEDKDDSHWAYSGLNDFQAYRREQAEWLKKEVASDAFTGARYRVLVHHIPLYNRKDEWVSTHSRALWADILKPAGVDLALCGHTHRSCVLEPDPDYNPYPVVIGGGRKGETATVTLLEADGERLTVTVLDAEGQVKHAYAVTP
jgi:3',5'-cyclic AMP phosphodiesterase CpdA